MATLVIFFLSAAAITFVFSVWWRRVTVKRVKYVPPKTVASVEKERILSTASEDAYDNIEPLPSFNWAETEPLQIRPFKDKYHLTMALENCPMSDLIVMDKNYKDRILHRRQLMEKYTPTVLAANEVIHPAVAELYDWMFQTYLPKRFPTMFGIVASPDSKEDQVLNLITNESIPLPAPFDPLATLRTLGAHIDEEFLLLLPRLVPSTDPSEPPQSKYHLEGFVNCFPNGFDTQAKLNLALADIHGPVPSYGAKIEKSMDRFFANLPVGKAVKRVNWSITTNDSLFAADLDNHLAPDQDQGEKEEDIDFKSTVLRCERQTLWRLPKSKALVFSFKTYQYPLEEIKKDGTAEALCRAIDGLSKGSVPEIAVYKRGVVWGEAVKKYLRS